MEQWNIITNDTIPKINSIEKDLNSIKTTINTNSNDINNINSKISNMEKDITSIKDSVQQLIEQQKKNNMNNTNNDIYNARLTNVYWRNINHVSPKTLSKILHDNKN